MTKEQLKEILEKHKKWLNNDEGGERANLRRADLREADLRGADLREADLKWANLSKADLRGADLRWANLSKADLREADLRGADLRGVDLDHSCWPLWCRTASSSITVDTNIKAQLLYHAFIVSCGDGVEPTEEQIEFIEQNFRRYDEVETL